MGGNESANDGHDGSLGKHLMDISAYSMQGRRAHMEDFYDIGYQLKPEAERRPNEWPYEYFYFGIFDGHGGDEAASFAKKQLLKMIVRQADFWSHNDEDVMRAIRQGFADTHAAMREQLSTWTRTNKTLPSTAGTTASVLFIKDGKFYSGHVGDSRIVISRKHPETNQWISQQVTEDHKPESDSETERITRAGGEVRSKFGVPRVVWRRPIWKHEFEDKLIANPKPADYDDCIKKIASYPVEESLVDGYQIIPFLAIARSLGDFWSINPQSGQYIVSPEPDVTCRPIDKYDTCILLATDGLWNVMKSSLAVRFLQELEVVKDGKRDSEEHIGEYFATDNFYDVSVPKNDKNHALSLVYMAYQLWERRRLRSDNITAVVAMLCDILPSQVQARPCTRRSSREHIIERSKNLITLDYIMKHTKQLEQTHIFCETIQSGSEPKFYATPASESETSMWQKIEEYLVFPPELFCSTKASIKSPNNYNRLYNARCRTLLHYDYYYKEKVLIYVKSVSDDPADEVQGETRVNKNNKKVRDSSCQATQPIHDFGQPWHQMRDQDDEDEDENIVVWGEGFDDLEDIDEDDETGFELVFDHELKVGDVVKGDRGRIVTVDEAYLAKIHAKKPSKKRRYEETDPEPIYEPYQTRSTRAHCV